MCPRRNYVRSFTGGTHWVDSDLQRHLAERLLCAVPTARRRRTVRGTGREPAALQVRVTQLLLFKYVLHSCL